MIDYLKGKLVFRDPSYVVIDVNGIGYKVLVSLNTYSDIKEQENIQLQTYLHIKEDSHTLFGFLKASEKQMFLDLISVNGVGPATGLMILSSLSSAEIKDAIMHGDVNLIKGVKGIGAKTAQRIILELKDRVAKIDVGQAEEFSAQSNNTVRTEALNALVTLGINRNVADKSVSSILKKNPDASLEELIKLALKSS